MAIIKDTETQFGVLASYHKIKSIVVSADMLGVSIVVESYLNNEVREKGATPLLSQTVFIPFTDFVDDPRSFVYPVLCKSFRSFMQGGVADTDELPVYNSLLLKEFNNETGILQEEGAITGPTDTLENEQPV